MKKSYLLSSFFLMFSFYFQSEMHAQNGILKGVVTTQSGEGLIGASFIEKGNKFVTTIDIE